MIGIFDSGIGGLTVVKAIQQQLSQYQLLYLGDTARTPYGNRSPELVYQFTEQAVDFLFQQGCELVVVACNTASAEALRKLQQAWLPSHFPRRRVLGVIRPVVEAVAATTRFGRVGVVGTRGTIASGAYVTELQKLKPTIQVFQQACPLLVPLIEEGWQNRPETMRIIRFYLRPLQRQRIDTLVLGCTHYPIAWKQLRQAAGKRIAVLDPAAVVAKKLEDYLNRHPEIETKLLKGSSHRFLVTDLTDVFTKNAQRWLGQEIILEKIVLP